MHRSFKIRNMQSALIARRRDGAFLYVVMRIARDTVCGVCIGRCNR